MKKLGAGALVLFLLTGCLGYRIGPVQPYYLRNIHAISVPTFENRTVLPRISELVTDSVIKQFQQDGTYRIVGDDKADAILKGQILRVIRSPVRSVRGNVLATSEFSLVMRVRCTLVDKKGKLLANPPEIQGYTSFFVGPDITSDERQALPLAAENVAVNLVSQLSEGW